jgi:hypothetical protein
LSLWEGLAEREAILTNRKLASERVISLVVQILLLCPLLDGLQWTFVSSNSILPDQ